MPIIRAAVVIVVATLTGCGGPQKGSEPVASDTLPSGESISLESAPDISPLDVEISSPRPSIDVVKRGAEPLTELRLGYVVGARGALTVRVAMKLGVSIDGVELVRTPTPTTIATTEISVTHASADRFRLSYMLIDLQLDGKREARGDDVSVPTEAVGVGAYGVLDRQGVVLASSFDEGGVGATGPAAGLREALTQSVVVLPAEPIGVGGTWTVTRPKKFGGIESEVKTTYEIISISGDSVEIRFTSKHSGNKGPIIGRSLPAGTTMTLLKLGGSESGKQTINLASPQPKELSVKGDIASRSRLTAGDSSQLIETSMKLVVEQI